MVIIQSVQMPYIWDLIFHQMNPLIMPHPPPYSVGWGLTLIGVLVLCASEGIAVKRLTAMNKAIIDHYYNLLEEVNVATCR